MHGRRLMMGAAELEAAEPRYVSPVPAGTDIAAGHKGAAMMGVDLKAQGRHVAGVLEATDDDGMPLYDDVTVQMARRSAKTTAIQAVLLGRCETRPNYRILQTAQDGTRASEVFVEMITMMEAAEPDEDKRSWTAFRSTGREYLRWDNGALWRVVPPKPGSFRSKAANVLWFDESGELEPAESEVVEAAALPTMDTRPDGQVIRSGTPGLLRAGTFHTSLEVARKAPDVYGIVDYHADDEQVVMCETWEDVEPLVQLYHPGVASGLTTLKTIKKRFEKMDTPKFLREYLCVWPVDNKKRALSLENWNASTAEHLAEPPAGVPWGIGYDVAIGGYAAAVAVAWIDADGAPHAQVMKHAAGSGWLPQYLFKANKAFPKIRIGYDSIGDNIAAAQSLQRMPRFRKPSLKALQLRDVGAGTAQLASAVKDLNFHHAAHKGLDAAVDNATWRESNGSRLFARNGEDISCLMAVVHALAVASTEKRAAPLRLPAAVIG